MSSTFSVRPSDSTATNNEALTNAKPDFDVISLLRERPNRNDGASAPPTDKTHPLDFGPPGQLYGLEQTSSESTEPNLLRDDPSVPVQLIDAATEIHYAQDAFRQGNPERGKEWLKEALESLKELSGSDEETCRTPSEDSGHDSQESGDEHSDDQEHSGSDSHDTEGGDSPPHESPPEAEPETPIQKVITMLVQALEALARGDMKQFQQLLSGIVSQLDEMLQGSEDLPPDSGEVPPPVTELPHEPSFPFPELPDLPGPPNLEDPTRPSLPFFPDLPFNPIHPPNLELPNLPSLPSLPDLPFRIPSPPHLELPDLPSFPSLPDLPFTIPSPPNLELPTLPFLPKPPRLELPKPPRLDDLFDFF